MKRILFVWLLVLLVHLTNAYGQQTTVLKDSNEDGLSGKQLTSHSKTLHSKKLSTKPLVTTITTTGKILIDRAHGGDFDISGFIDYLISLGWIADDLISGSVDSATLNEYDIYIIPKSDATAEFSSDEVLAVNTYVNQGGGLWVFSDYNTDPTMVNSVSNQFGVTFNYDSITDPTNNNQGNSSWPIIYLLITHDITQGVDSYVYYAGCSLNVSSPAEVIGRGDVDTTSLYYSSYPPVLASAVVGNGRAVFSGDITPLHPSYYPSKLQQEETLLLSNIVDWLTSSSTTPTPTPATTPLSTLQPLPSGVPTLIPQPTDIPTQPAVSGGEGAVFGFVNNSDDDALEGVTVTITGVDYSNSTETDETGFYQFNDLAAGDYTLTYEKEGYQSQSLDISLDENEAQEVETIILEVVVKAKITGYVLNIQDDPIESVKLRLKGIKKGSNNTSSSDADGYFEFDNLEADTYVLVAKKKGYKRAKQTIRLEEEEETEIEIEMKKTSKRIIKVSVR